MSREFTIIETQEQLDEVIKGRLGELNKKHAEATAELQNKLEALTSENASLTKTLEEGKKKDEEYSKTLENLEAKVKDYETFNLKAKIARESNLPFEMANRITGENEEQMREDAKALSKYFSKPNAPLASGEPAPSKETKEDGKDAMREMLKSLTK